MLRVVALSALTVIALVCVVCGLVDPNALRRDHWQTALVVTMIVWLLTGLVSL